MDKQNILSLLNSKFSKNESSNNFDFSSLMKKVTFKETDTHLHIYNFPSAFGDTQNKNNRVYDQTSLKEASNWFNNVHKDNPYFGYIFDGHRDEDSYENIVGRIITLRTDESTKCVLSDLKINKGAKAYNTIKNIVKDGDPVGISMRIISPNAMYLSKNEVGQLNEEVLQLSEDNAGINELMGKDDEIEYISGNAYIQRFDLTQFPSFNRTYVGKAQEESVKMKEYTESACLLSNYDRCITDSCRFKRTVKDFLELITKNESITTIKDHPTLYDDMLKFSYMNLSEFNFDDIKDIKYLTDKLKDFKLDRADSTKQIKTIEDLAGKDNLLNYITSGNRLDADTFVKLLNGTLMKVIDVDEVFYQVITINYLHWMILSSIIIEGKDELVVQNSSKLAERLGETAPSDDNNLNDILVALINGLSTKEVTAYDFTNIMFNYIYAHVDRFSSMAAPIAIVSESFERFKKYSTKKLFNKSFIK